MFIIQNSWIHNTHHLHSHHHPQHLSRTWSLILSCVHEAETEDSSTHVHVCVKRSVFSAPCHQQLNHIGTCLMTHGNQCSLETRANDLMKNQGSPSRGLAGTAWLASAGSLGSLGWSSATRSANHCIRLTSSSMAVSPAEAKSEGENSSSPIISLRKSTNRGWSFAWDSKTLDSEASSFSMIVSITCGIWSCDDAVWLTTTTTLSRDTLAPLRSVTCPAGATASPAWHSGCSFSLTVSGDGSGTGVLRVADTMASSVGATGGNWSARLSSSIMTCSSSDPLQQNRWMQHTVKNHWAMETCKQTEWTCWNCQPSTLPKAVKACKTKSQSKGCQTCPCQSLSIRPSPWPTVIKITNNKTKKKCHHQPID